MKRKTKLAALVFLVATATLTFSQQSQTKPSPMVPAEIPGPQLIAWSQLQKPRPVSQPLPVDNGAPQAEEKTQRSANSASQEAPRQAPAAQTLTGMIVKDGDRYVLKVSSTNTYDLDDQERAQKYEGKQVKVAGALDAKGGTLRIISIELLS